MECETDVQNTVKAKGRATDTTRTICTNSIQGWDTHALAITICTNSIQGWGTHALGRITYYGSRFSPMLLLLT